MLGGAGALACAPAVLEPAPYAPAIAFAPCDAQSAMNGVDGAECGTLEVPVDWRSPESARMTLEVARVRATPSAAGGTERIGVLTFDFGGPGIPAITRLASLSHSGRAEALAFTRSL